MLIQAPSFKQKIKSRLTAATFLIAGIVFLSLVSLQVKLIRFLLVKIPHSLAVSSDVIDLVRAGSVFVRSNGSDTVQISDSGTEIGTYPSRITIKKPDGTLFNSVTKYSTDSASTPTYNLTDSGDYQIVMPLPSRVWSFSTTASMVLRPNKRKRTFRGLNGGHSASKMYFYVPAGTSTFSFFAMATSGTQNAADQAILYNPDGSTNTTLDLTIDTNGQTWSSTVINSPTSGYWAASININGTNSEGTYWVEGVPNYFAPTTGDWFEPNLTATTVNVSIDPGTVLGDMGKVGAGRLRESSAVPAPVEAAFTDIGMQSNEVILTQTNREPSNDNSDPFSLNLSGYNFSNVATDYTAQTLHVEPLLGLNSPATWLATSGLATTYSSCGSNKECLLQEPWTKYEWGEFALAMVTHYNVATSDGIRYLRIIDEPNADPIPATNFAALFNEAAARIATDSDSRVNSVKLYSGAVAEIDETGDAWAKTVIANITPAYNQYIGIHPWLMGYAGLGNIYSTPYIKERMDDYLSRMAALGGPTPKKAIFSEVNAKYGDSVNQDVVYYSSFDHAIWWWSVLANVFSNAGTEEILYYPFEDQGSVFTSRGMVTTAGSYKPVAYAAKYFNQKVKPKVISTSVQGNNLEVEALTTADSTQSAMNVNLVNKGDRVQNVNLNFSFTSAKSINWDITSMATSTATAFSATASGTNIARPGTWTLPATMSAQSLYNVSLSLSTPTNTAPVVGAGVDAAAVTNVSTNLDGTVSDDGFPDPPNTLTYSWTKQSGPGNVTFGTSTAVDTTATFDTAGAYVIRLTSSDSELSSYDEVTITVADPSPTPTPTYTPTDTPTDTPIPPTNTPIPPTDTPLPPTNTPIPPTATPTDTPLPPTATPTPTDTPLPPTATPTNTPIPPTATPTHTPTDTPTNTPTNTPVPTATSTSTPIPTATSTTVPTPTTAAIAESVDISRGCNEYCSDNSECASDYTCYYNRCRLPRNLGDTSCSGSTSGSNRSCNEYCADTSECASGLTCYYNRCRLPDRIEDTSCSVVKTFTSTCDSYCADTSECSFGLVCYYNHCRNSLNLASNVCSAITTKSTQLSSVTTTTTSENTGSSSNQNSTTSNLSSPSSQSGTTSTPTSSIVSITSAPTKSTTLARASRTPTPTATVTQPAKRNLTATPISEPIITRVVESVKSFFGKLFGRK